MRRAYYQRCQAFLAFIADNAKQPIAWVVSKLRSGEGGFYWGLLGGSPDAIIERSRMEALRYIVEYEAGNVR